MVYTFGEYELDTRRCELRRAGESRHLEPQAYDVLAYLLRHRDRLVTKAELLESVWGSRFVTPATLSSRLKSVRQAVGDDGKGQTVIRTVRGRGFRFVAPVSECEDAPEQPILTAPPVEAALGGVGPHPSAQQAAGAVSLSPSHPASHLVGRRSELERLDELLRTASTGVRQIVFVTGESGIGKTTLLEMFLERARAQRGTRFGRGQCLHQRGAGEPYMPVLEALGRLCRERDGADLVALLARYAPTWLAQMPSLLDAEQLEVVQRRAFGGTRERMLREMVEAIEAFTADTPLVLMLEDLHWSDPSTLDLLGWIGQRPEPARLLVLSTYRSDEVADGLPDLVRKLRQRGSCVDMTLSAWTEADVRAYLAARLRPTRPPDDLVESVLRRTDGHPLFVRSLIDEWVETGALAQRGDEWRINARLEQLARTVPATLRASIEQRIERLSLEDQHLLETASIAGGEFAAASAAAALGREEEEVEARLVALARQGWVVHSAETSEWPDGTLTSRFAFAHHLYRELLYNRTPLSRRTRLHERIGRRLESAYGSRAADLASELALHFRLGRDDARAIRYLRHAAEQALGRSAHHEAIGHLTAALEILRRRPELPDADQIEVGLQRMLGSTLLVTRGWRDPEAERAYERARELAEILNDSEQLAKVLYGLAYLHEIRGDYQQSQSLIERRINLQLPRQASGPLAEAHELLSCSLFHQGSFDAALGHARRGLDLTEREHRNNLFAALGEHAGITCLYWAGLALWFLGQPDEAAVLVLRSIERATDDAHIHVLSIAEAQAARLFQHRREPDQVAEHAERSLSLAVRQGYPHQRAIAQTLLGWAEVVRGRTRSGLELIRSGLEGQAALGAGMERPYAVALLADALAHAGQDEEALTNVNEALAHAEANERSFFWGAELRRLRGVLLLRRGSPPLAEASMREALDVAARQRARSLELRSAVSLCRLWHKTGRALDAPSRLRGVLASFTEGFDTPDVREARALLEQCAGAGESEHSGRRT